MSVEANNLQKMPDHIAVIMDGNGRWAKERGLQRVEGHKEGAKAVQACLEGCLELGVKWLTMYAFSVENWKRPQEEVQGLMSLLEIFLDRHEKNLVDKKVRFATIGRVDQLSESVQKKMKRVKELTCGFETMQLTLAINYGGREEIVDAVNRALEAREISAENKISAAKLESYLDTAGWPDPDVMIRTSGEMRLSNFMLWQMSYTELVVLEKYWPDFHKSDLIDSVKEFQRRQRRFGGVY
jgi:undecaprenyl diphosphate synthase